MGKIQTDNASFYQLFGHEIRPSKELAYFKFNKI